MKISFVTLWRPDLRLLAILDDVGKRLHIPPARIFINIDRYGNTSAASIPIALDECVRQGLLKRGDIALLVAFGGGLTWGANVIEF